jgi:hypothetical protein
MSTAKAAMKAGKKKSDEGDKEISPKKKANNVTVGTLGEVKGGGEGESTAADTDDNYVYRDFSQIPEEDFDVDYEIDQEGLLQVSLTGRSNRVIW